MSIKLQFALVGLSLVAAAGAAVVVPWGHSPIVEVGHSPIVEVGHSPIVEVGHSPYEANIVAVGEDVVNEIEGSQLTDNTFGSEVSGFPSGRRAYRHRDGPSRTKPCVDVNSKCEYYKGKCVYKWIRDNCKLTCGGCAECFETRVGYGGRNLRKGEVKGGNPKKIKGDVKECQAMCASTYSCNFFTFRGNECTLMSEVLNKFPHYNTISGSNKNTCAENGIPIFGMIQGFEPNTGKGIEPRN